MADLHHIASVRLYLAVFGVLLMGTIATVVAASFDLGPFNNIVMLTIACTKATFVILYFMHVRWGTRLTWVIAGSGFFWLLIMFTFTMTDYFSRGWVVGTLR